MSKIQNWAIIAALLLAVLYFLNNANMGRYQMVQRGNDSVMVMDTKTGQCWVNYTDQSWAKLPALPTQ